MPNPVNIHQIGAIANANAQLLIPNRLDCTPKVSIIIPVFNVEDYLAECLDSVINQSLREIEVICVDDGSTDSSLEILKEYAQRDKRIAVITQENQKLGTARNNAMKIASGEYILFLDSDDWIREDSCEILYNIGKDNDGYMINFEGINHFPEGYKEQGVQQTIYYTDKTVLDKAEVLSLITRLPISAGRYFYKRSFLTYHKLEFPDRLLFEDNIFVRKGLLLTENLCTCREVLYQRRVHKGSITQNWDKNFSDYLKMTIVLEKELSNLPIDAKVKDVIMGVYYPQILNRYKNFNFYYRKLHHDQVQNTLKILKKDPTINLNKIYVKEIVNWYQSRCGRVLYMDYPLTYNEKVQWLKLYDSTPLKTKLADKYLVREWVKEKIGEQYLIPLLGVYDQFEEIDFDKLPDRFVIKCNHGCGYNIIVKNKADLDLADIKSKLDAWMSENFAFRCGFDLHYRDIQPKIIIEKYIENKLSHGDLYDYKFWCFNGKVEYIQFLSERNTGDHGLKMAFYDRKWNKQDFVYSYPLDTETIARPDNFPEMLRLAEKLAKGFSHVRVDFYRMDDGQIYFREMIFTTASGKCKWNREDVNRYFGDLIKLPKCAYDIDTGKYYKLPRPSLWKKYLLFPYYKLKLRSLKNAYLLTKTQQVLESLRTMRVDIKNFGGQENAVVINSEGSQISQPAWARNDMGIGQLLVNSKVKQKFHITAIRDGKLVLAFRGVDRRHNKERVPLWIDFSSIKIDGKEILSHTVPTWHDKPFRYELPVKDGQKVSVEIGQSYHPYNISELKKIVSMLDIDPKYLDDVVRHVHQIVKNNG